MNYHRIFGRALKATMAVVLVLSFAIAGNVKNNGTIVNAATKSITVTGFFQNYNTAAGRLDNAGTFTVTGNFLNSNGALNGSTANFIGAGAGTIDVTGNYQNSTGFTYNSLATSLIKVGGTLTNTSANNFSTDTGAVEYKGVAGGQSIVATVKNATYGGLTASGAGGAGNAKVLAADITVTGNVNIAASTQLGEAGHELTVTNANPFTVGGGAVLDASSNANSTTNYAATGAQNVLGATYAKMIVQNTGQKSAQGAVAVSNLLTMNSANDSLDFVANTFTLDPGASVTSTGKLMASGTVTVPAFNPTIGGTFVYYGATQTVAGANYTNLVLRGGSKTLPGTDSVAVSGTYAFEGSPATTYQTGNSFIYNSTTAQSIVGGQNYFQLIAEGSADTSLSNAKTVAGGALTIQNNAGAGVLVRGNTTLDMAANTISFGASHTDSVDGTSRIRWNTNGTSQYLGGTGITEFYGTNPTTVAVGTYGSLWFSGTGTKTIGAGTVTVDGGSVLSASIGVRIDNNLTVTGALVTNNVDLNNNGTLTNNGSVTVN